MKHLRYWVDKQARKIFCLVEAPDAEVADTVHRKTNGLVAEEIYAVSEHPSITAFLNHAMPAITHVAVTVTDPAASEAWYTRLLGVDPVLDEDAAPYRHIVYQLGSTLLGLHAVPDRMAKDTLRERLPGLDRVSFGVANRDELADWATRLDELGITHGPITDATYGSGLTFRDPDDIVLELFAPPACGR